MEQQTQQRRLGRGLSALLGGNGPTGGTPDAQAADHSNGFVENTIADDSAATGELRHVAIENVEASPFQPRREFDGDCLNELAGSVREHGILAPLLVRELAGGYQLVAGERRLRAAKKAGLMTIPVRVVDVVDQTACEFALEENLKRSDLNDMEKARAFQRYLDQFQTTQEELAKQLSMSRPALTNILRLLDLPEVVQQSVEQGAISAGHAKAILSLEEEADRVALCNVIQTEGLSVRKAEAAAKKLREGEPEASAREGIASNAQPEAVADGENPDILPMQAAEADHQTSHVRDLESQLRDRFGVNVSIKLNAKDAGEIVLPFTDNAEFERLLAALQHGQGQQFEHAA